MLVSGPATVKEVAEYLSVHRSVGYRHLKDLVDLGLVTSSGTYGNTYRRSDKAALVRTAEGVRVDIGSPSISGEDAGVSSSTSSTALPRASLAVEA